MNRIREIQSCAMRLYGVKRILPSFNLDPWSARELCEQVIYTSSIQSQVTSKHPLSFQQHGD